MTHITQEQARELATKAGISQTDYGSGPFIDDGVTYAQLQALCNAAIEWHIAQQAASVDATFKKWNAEHEPENEPAVSLASQRPINCGSGYCSCIECLYEPSIPQILEQLANEPPISGNHMARTRVLLAADMYKKDQKMNTSQERVQKGEKSIHETALTKAVEISQEYKLP